MYRIFKTILISIFPKIFLINNEFLFRSLYAVLYSGDSYQCNVCNCKLRKFVKNNRKELLCPKCGSLSRDRRLFELLKNEFLKDNYKVLDFSPSRSLSRELKKNKGINYLPTDLSGNFNADFNFDITEINLKSSSIDLIICYHILEHIEEDIIAMKELYRVLKSNRYCIIQTPFKGGDIYEDSSIILPEDRLIHFGQEDHVRIYSVDGLKERLINTGFEVEVRNFSNEKVYYGLIENEIILIVKKIEKFL